ncbi:Right handed beta helix region [Xaviernesmea oryzae]|uniref:Right handed beta helix region n=1 Tax=Xaviernesmea oryzae TaxID=464029 RepID=A0A1X7FFH9_9HYPH|nr:right-handed parallel beta-helix repeat-containing protein [Xaviernesmea oryzae]SMF51084.1 Right handed beta helix region [Xaviernesmea oryzae]
MRFRLPRLGRRLLPIVFMLSALGLSGPAAADAPHIFWASDPVKPGQTVQVSGMGLAAVEKVEVARLIDHAEDRTASRPEPEKAEVLAKSDSSLSFILPKHFAPGVFSVTLRSEDATSSFQLNAPDIYWVQGDRGPAATPGGWLRLSGRNMAVTDRAVAKLIGEDAKEIRLNVAGPDIWSASFPIPDDAPAGSYRVHLWNGAGDASAWRDAGTIEIEPGAQTERPVMELFSNQPDSADHDDTARINAAMGALHKRGGGTLLLHYGIYRLTGTLEIPEGVVLKGESNDLVTLIWKDTETPPGALIEGVRDFSVEDMTINAFRHFDIIKGGFDPLSGKASGRNVAVRRVIVRASSFLGRMTDEDAAQRLQAMRGHRQSGVVGLLLGGSNIVVEDCDILSSMRPFLLMGPKGARLTGNTFRTGRRGWYSISGPDGVLFENNRIIGTDLQASGGGINTLEGYVSARNVLIRNNRFETMYGNDREAMTSDGPGGYYSGPLTAVLDRSVWIDPAGPGVLKDRNWEGAGLFVVKGQGLGLVARIVKKAGEVLDLDRDISGLAENDSIVSILPMQENYLIVGNHFEDVGQIQIYGAGYRHVFADNTALRSTGFGATSLYYKHLQPNFYIQFLNNEVTGPAFRHAARIDIAGRQFKDNDTLLAFGTVIRENRLRAAATIRVDGRSATAPAIRNVLIEQNEITRTDIGIDIGQGVDELTLRDNVMSDVRIPVRQPIRKPDQMVGAP